jgi:hypothetical protein
VGANRQALAGLLGRDRRGAPPHRLDLPERETGEQVARDRGQDQGDRPRDQQLVAERGQRLGPILQRRADDEHQRAPVSSHRRRQQARRLVEAWNAPSVGEERSLPSPTRFGPAQERRTTERRGRLEHAPFRAHELRVALAPLDQRRAAVLGQRGPRAVDERAQVLGTEPQVPIASGGEMRAESQVEEET